MKKKRDTILERLEIQGDCIVWIGSKTIGGYGTIMIDRRVYYMHRLSWMMHNGRELPAHQGVVRHKCDNPPCVNPDHLDIGTHHDNAYDAFARGRNPNFPNPGKPVEGAFKNSIDPLLLSAMRRLSWDRDFMREVADHFGVSERYVHDLAAGTYKRELKEPLGQP